MDHVGFVFHAASPRAISPGHAARLARSMPPSIGRVGLFVGADPARIASTLEQVGLTALQLYDTPERIAALRRRPGVEHWYAKPVTDPSEAGEAGGAWCDLVVIEAAATAGSDRPGGHGTRLDWASLAGRTPGMPWMLAGGLDPDNVADAIRLSGARMVDVSSGVETGPGRKDPSRIAEFAAAARQGFADALAAVGATDGQA